MVAILGIAGEFIVTAGSVIGSGLNADNEATKIEVTPRIKKARFMCVLFCISGNKFKVKSRKLNCNLTDLVFFY